MAARLKKRRARLLHALDLVPDVLFQKRSAYTYEEEVGFLMWRVTACLVPDQILAGIDHDCAGIGDVVYEAREQPLENVSSRVEKHMNVIPLGHTFSRTPVIDQWVTVDHGSPCRSEPRVSRCQEASHAGSEHDCVTPHSGPHRGILCHRVTYRCDPIRP